jgi:hypothetical protein
LMMLDIDGWVCFHRFFVLGDIDVHPCFLLFFFEFQRSVSSSRSSLIPPSLILFGVTFNAGRNPSRIGWMVVERREGGEEIDGKNLDQCGGTTLDLPLHFYHASSTG